jgi:hypothetical protein
MKDPNKLFDFIDIMFLDKKAFDKLKPYQKARHFFMVNRFMSIDQPVRANFLQHIKINAAEAINFWQMLMTARYNRKPGWMFVSTKKKKEEKKNQYVEEATINEYCKKYGYSKRQIDDTIQLFGDKFINELKAFEKMINQ